MIERAIVVTGAVNRIQDLLPSPFNPLGFEECSKIIENALDSVTSAERDVELRVIGRVSQSGFGPGSDICETVWRVLAKYGIHPDGKTSLAEYVERLAIHAKGGS